MPSFSKKSNQRLATCHEDLQTLFNEVVKHNDCSILCGARTAAEQDEAFKAERSQVRWPDSKHNRSPSEAIDAAPYPVDYDSAKALWDFCFFAGYVLGVAEQLYQIGAMTRRVRWGGDWDSDMRTADNKFDDLAHFELMPERT